MIMNKALFLLISMLWCHIIGDWILQPDIMKNGKCKSWWEENYPDKLYQDDYMMVLFIHSFLWSITTHIPFILLYLLNDMDLGGALIGAILLQTLIHHIIDDVKANEFGISLKTDQQLHMLQVVGSFIFLI